MGWAFRDSSTQNFQNPLELHPRKKKKQPGGLMIQESKIPAPSGRQSSRRGLQTPPPLLFLWHIPEPSSELTLMEIPGGPGEPGGPGTPGTPGCPFCPCGGEKRDREGFGNLPPALGKVKDPPKAGV